MQTAGQKEVSLQKRARLFKHIQIIHNSAIILSAAAFGKQFKRADRCGADWALILGDDEVEQNVVRLKRLRGGSQEQTLSLASTSAIVDTLRSR